MATEEKRHVYHNSKGEEIPSVTKIINIVKKKGLNSWANAIGLKGQRLKPYMNEKALIGTLVHEKIEHHFTGEKVDPYIDESIDIEVDKRFKNFLLWVEASEVKPIWQEREFHNEKYGGKIDMLGKIGDKTVLIDFKTSKKPTSSHFMQLGGYLNLIQYNEPEMYKEISHGLIVCVNDKGVEQGLKNITVMREYQKAFDACFALFTTWNTILKREWGEDLIDLDL